MEKTPNADAPGGTCVEEQAGERAPEHAASAADAQLGDLMRARAQVYALLARLFEREVDEGLLAQLKQGVFSGSAEGSLGEARAMIEGYLASDEASVLDLARDYAKAFCGAGSTKMNSAYPYESVYTSKDCHLMQEARDEALAWYHRFGLGKNEQWHDCEDHLGVELEFVSFLARECARAADAGNVAETAEFIASQRDFIGQHLVNWLPEFDRDVDRKARTDFYRGLARFTSHYAREDLAVLDGLAG